jgi:phage recombination protein Bet
MEFTDKELKALRTEYASNATDAQFDLWIETCKRRNLVPVEDIVLQLRAVKEYDETAKAKIYKNKVVFITTIRALLKLAERTKKYKGFVPAEYIYLEAETGLPKIVSEIPLPDSQKKDKPMTPWAARVGVKREGFEDPQFTVARFGAYAQSYKDADGNKHLNETWANRGPEQLVKCAKAAALREAFPEELGGLFLKEEFQDDEETPKAAPATTPEPSAPTVAPPATVAPPVSQVPAEGKVAPRPGEKKDLPAYTPPLTLEDKLEFERNAQRALHAVTDPTPVVPIIVPESPADTPKEAVKEAVKQPDVKGGGKRARAKKETTKPSEAPATEPATKAPESPESSKPEEPKVDIMDANRLPTKAEFSETMKKIAALRDRVGGAGSPGSGSLRSYILKKSSKADTKDVLVQEWIDIFKTLEDAVDDDDLKGIIAKGLL